MHFLGASFRAIIFSLDRLCNERLFAPFVRLLSFNSVVKQKSAAAVEKKAESHFAPWHTLQSHTLHLRTFRVLTHFAPWNTLLPETLYSTAHFA